MKGGMGYVLVAIEIVFLFASFSYAHLCDNVFRQADKLIVKPENYNLLVKDKTTFKIFLQNNMDRAIAARIVAMLVQFGPGQDILFCGGGARSPALKSTLQQKIGRDITVLPDPQFVVALGAALSACL
jgi:hypothetical protein